MSSSRCCSSRCRPTTRSRASATCGSPTWPTTRGSPARTDCECNRLINRACAIAGFEPRIAFETDDYTAMQGFVAAGVGVSMIAELGLTTIRDDIVVRSLGRETPVREVFAATLLEAHRTPATQAMLEILTRSRRATSRAARSFSSWLPVERVDDGLRAVARADLGEDVVHVALHGGGGDHEPLGDLRVVRPSAIRPSTSASRGVRSSRRLGRRR